MLKLLKIEWLKIKTYRAFWVLFLSFVILYPGIYFFTASKWSEDHSVQETSLKNMLDAPFSFPGAWLSSAYFAGIFFTIICMLFIMLITNEVQYRTHRQNIIDGWSRMDFLMAKVSVMLALVFVATVLVAVCGFLVGNRYSPHSSASEGIKYIGYFAIMALLYMVVAFFIAILIKRTGLAIIVYFAVIWIADNILWAIFYFQGSQLAYFMPVECADSLVSNPFKPKFFERRDVSDLTLIITVFVYISLYAYIISNRFKNTDLKT